MADQRIGVYPGTFDPITGGHMDVIQRAAGIVDKLVVGIATNDGKGPLFDVDERLAMVRGEVDAELGADAERVEVRAFDILLMSFASECGATIIIRGLRAVSDFEYEFQLASMNRKLAPDVETMFLTPDEGYSFISSSLVREIAALGGDVRSFVHPEVQKALKKRRG